MMSYNDKVKYVHHFLSGKMSPEEMDAFALWRSSDSSHEILFSELKNIWDNSKFVQPIKFDYNKAFLKHKTLLDASDEGVKISDINKDKPRGERTLFPIKYIAAAIFILALAVVFLIQNNNEVFNAYENQSLTLADGTKVWMDKGAELKVLEIDENNRRVELKGKAYFDVAPNKNAPFTIANQNFSIRVLGTKFVVNGLSNLVDVKDGRVEVYNAKEKVVITANQSAKITDQSTIEVTNKNFDSNMLWFNEDLSFNNTPFDVVINDLRVYYNIKISIPEQKDWSRCTFTSGPLKTSTVDEVLMILKLTYDLDYIKQKDNSIKISKVKCK